MAYGLRRPFANFVMQFRATHFDALFNFAGANDQHANHHAAGVGVLASWRSGNALLPASGNAGGRPPVVARLREIGVDYRFETARTITEFSSLARPHSTLEVLLCDDVVSLDTATVSAIGNWVRSGDLCGTVPLPVAT